MPQRRRRPGPVRRRSSRRAPGQYRNRRRAGNDCAVPLTATARRFCNLIRLDRSTSGRMEDQIMSGTTEQFEGGCLCGAVRFVATGLPKGVYWCHCQSCRRHTGAPASVFVAFERAAYTVTKGEITKFDSTPGRTRRGFCARCGSTLTCESARLSTETHFPVGAFDRAAELQPTRHVFPEERLAWFHPGD